MITGEQGARKPASPVREETDGKGPGQGHLAGGRLHAEGGPGKPTGSDPGRAPRSDPTGRFYRTVLNPLLERINSYGCGSSEVSWLRCEDESVAVSGAVDAFVLAAEVEAPVVLEVAAGDQGAEFQDGLGAF